jgi:dipeptidase D
MSFVATLAPEALWAHFDRILTIPRGSKNEEAARAYVIEVAERHGLAYEVDGAGNVVVRKPASPGHEGAPTTILQSHLDMVNDKNADVEHDFDTDPIVPQQDGEYLKATGTTLGADNGIGVAAMLAVMEATDFAHGPIECLFTIDEETGLTGAAQLSAALLTGRQLINLDSEEEGALYVGCAGGGDSELLVPLTSAPCPDGAVGLDVALRGMRGGHSGVDIHLQRANAVKLLARAIYSASLAAPLRLGHVAGGNKHNAIPREATATIVVAADQADAVRAAIAATVDDMQAEFGAADPDITLGITEADAPAEAWDDATTQRVLQLLTALPHGVLGMSYDIPDLVETSTNLATVAEQDGALAVGLSSRSSVDSAIEALRERIRAMGMLAGATVTEGNAYPGWKPNLQSRLLGVVQRVQQDELGSTPEIKAIHAGLECGIIGEKVPGMDMISFGPQIEFPHSPDERVHIGSVERFYTLLTATLSALASN